MQNYCFAPPRGQSLQDLFSAFGIGKLASDLNLYGIGKLASDLNLFKDVS
jgi:hypothetical protein